MFFQNYKVLLTEVAVAATVVADALQTTNVLIVL